MPARKVRELPSVGKTFTKSYFGKTHTLEVIRHDGEIKYKVGKRIFNSPSAAAKAVTQQERNGWIFWGIEK